MSKEILLGKNSRDELVKGIDILADAVVSTLGPNGRNVVISNGLEEPISTKDGVTVAKNITLKNPTQELGAKLIKQAASKTADKAGDGTTTSTLLAREMVKLGLKHLNNGENAVEISRSIKTATKKVIENLRTNISEQISKEGQLKQVATISSNNDIIIGSLIADSLTNIGLEGAVYIEESKTGETYLENVEGLQFDKGFKSPYFVTNNETRTCVLDNPLVLIIDGSLTKVNQMLPILERVSNDGKSLLIIADDIESEALATLIVNKMRGVMRVCAVKAPEFGDRRKLVLEDIAITTGGTVFSTEKGMKLDNFNYEWFGKARTITVTRDETTIIDGEGKTEEIEKRINELQKQIKNSISAYETEKLQERLAKFVGGVAIIHVGGNTETEMREKKDRVDDALHATRAAIEEGIIPGGGVALLYAREVLNKEDIGESIVYEACGKPFEQILKNAGFDSSMSGLIALSSLNSVQVGKNILDVKDNNKWKGYDLKSSSVVNMKNKGIIDPTKVTRTALENAASVASIVLLTECSIVDIPEEKNGKNDGIDPSMFGY